MTYGLHHIALIVSDEAASIKFYKTLGFEVRARHERPEHHDVIVMMEGGGVVLEMFVDASHPPRVSGPEAMGLRHLGLSCVNASLVHEILVRTGYEPEPIRMDAFIGENMFFVKDPDGQPIEIHESAIG